MQHRAETPIGSSAVPTGRSIHRLAMVALVLCALSVVGSLAIGWATYRASRAETERRLQRLYLAEAQLAVGQADRNRDLPDDELLASMEAAWLRGQPAQDEYLCVFDEQGRLLAHTARPETIGHFVGDNRLLGDEGDRTLADLTGEDTHYLGDYVSSAGQLQVAAFHPVPGRDWTLGIHRPKVSVVQEARAGLRSLAIGFRVVCGFMLPLSLLVLFVVVVRALRARDAADEALHRSELQHRAIAEDMPNLLCRFRPGCVLTYVNEAYATYFGRTRREMVGLSFLTLIPEEQGAALMEQLSSLTPEVDTCDTEHEVVAADEEPRWQRWTNRALFDERGVLIEYQAVGEDVTERRRLQARLEQATRMEAIGRLAGGVAHDLNNMLTPILGCASILAEELADRPEQAELADEIGQAGRRARGVVQQLLAFGRKQTLTRRTVKLDEVLRDLEPMLRRTIREDVRIEVACAPNLPPIHGDSGQLEQVMLNLVLNAQDAMPAGGTMRLRLLVHSSTGTDDLAPGEHLVLEVEDEGSGMTEEIRARVFEPFFTTKEEQGTGLGLSSVFGIVKQHGGSVLCESEPGSGTVFRVFLPVQPSPDVAVPGIDSLDDLLDIQDTGRILLVEDDPMVRRLAHRILGRSGFEVLEAADAAAALEVAATLAEPPDLLLTDVVMPGLSGPELFESLSRRWPDLAVLFISGYPTETTPEFDLSDGAKSLRKPFTAAALIRKVRSRLAT